MKSLFKRLQRRKGFTLVECIVAIAVFAAFCLMVMMIVAGAQKESILANDTEKELNGLVENVLVDDINRGYNTTYSTNTLNLNLSGDGISGTKTFAITYDVVDGHKNYVVCSSCGYFGNNTEFMDGVSSENFKPWVDNYKCPECGTTISGSTDFLKCQDCNQIGNYKNSDKEYDSAKAWTYQPGSGAFICNHCGGSTVSYKGVDDEKLDSAYLSVSGMAANAIRYGSVKHPTQQSVIAVTDDSGAANDKAKANIKVKYNGDVTKPYDVGEYRIDITSIQKPDDPDTTDTVVPQTKISISIPNGYYIEDLKCNGSSTLPANLSVVQPNYTTNEKGSLTWTTDGTGAVGSNVYFTFKLRNYKTGFSFDYDYQNVQVKVDKTTKVFSGLYGYWFSLTSNGGNQTWPVPETP